MSRSVGSPPVRYSCKKAVPGTSRCARFAITPAGCWSGSLSWSIGPEAEAVRGMLLTAAVESDERPAEPGEFYDRHLIGLRAATPDGAEVGRVRSVLHLPAQDVLGDRNGRWASPGAVRGGIGARCRS